MRKVKVLDVALITIIAVPLVIAKVKSDRPNKTTTDHDFPVEKVVETEAVAETEEVFKPYYGYSFIVPVETETEIVTEVIETVEETTVFENEFVGYSFIPLSVEDQQAIKTICDNNNLAYELMLAIAEQESYFDMSAHNPLSDDYGLFQINENTWNDIANELGFYNYKWTVEDNTAMACYIINHCLTLANGDLRIALNYYRTGTPNTRYESDSDYASIVLNNLNNIANGRI